MDKVAKPKNKKPKPAVKRKRREPKPTNNRQVPDEDALDTPDRIAPEDLKFLL